MNEILTQLNKQKFLVLKTKKNKYKDLHFEIILAIKNINQHKTEIENLKNLKYLSIFRTEIKNLDAIRKLENLRTIYAYSTNIRDLNKLAELKSLVKININNILLQRKKFLTNYQLNLTFLE